MPSKMKIRAYLLLYVKKYYKKFPTTVNNDLCVAIAGKSAKINGLGSRVLEYAI